MKTVFCVIIIIFNVYGQDFENFSPSVPLCQVNGCSCHEDKASTSLHVRCDCDKNQELKIGPSPHLLDIREPPTNTGMLLVENCHHVELYSRLLNHMKNIQNITIRNTHKVVIHSKLYEDVGAGGGTINSIELTNIQNLKVQRNSFKDVKVMERFFLNKVHMANMASMAFDFEYVKDFSVFASKFDRISMFGIQLHKCKEFNVLGMSQFSSLAAHAIKVKCDKFSLAYNWLGHLQDSSFDVEFGLCDIQGNTFHSLGGKPFLNLRPIIPAVQSGANEIAMTGFVFRENKFASKPVLPFASLALPSFSLLSPSDSYLDIENNQFPCSCSKLGWLLAFGKFGYNSHSLAEVGNTKGGGSMAFIRQLYNTAGPCVECDQKECRDTGMDMKTYGENILEVQLDNSVTCGDSGVTIKNFDENIDVVERLATPLPWREVEETSQGRFTSDDVIDNIKKQNKKEYKKEEARNLNSTTESFISSNSDKEKIQTRFLNISKRNKISPEVLFLITLCIF